MAKTSADHPKKIKKIWSRLPIHPRRPSPRPSTGPISPSTPTSQSSLLPPRRRVAFSSAMAGRTDAPSAPASPSIRAHLLDAIALALRTVARVGRVRPPLPSLRGIPSLPPRLVLVRPSPSRRSRRCGSAMLSNKLGRGRFPRSAPYSPRRRSLLERSPLPLRSRKRPS